MDIEFIERFIASAQEIDRRRKVIARVIGAVLKQLQAQPLGKHFVENSCLVEVPLDAQNAMRLYFAYSDENGKPLMDVTIGKARRADQERLMSGEMTWECPLRFVSTGYWALPVFVTKVHDVIPVASVKEYFDLIISQAI